MTSPAPNRLREMAISIVFVLCTLSAWSNVHAASDKKIQQRSGECPALLNHQFPRLQDEKVLSMCQFQGQVLLVVNTASYCGYTGQYDELEKLHSQFKTRGFSVVGFPSNDFGNQEPKSNREIADFCTNTFGVQFPMFSKSTVKGKAANPLYKKLAEATGEQPGWNFHKYLINRKGEVVGTFKSSVSPSGPEIDQAIRRALDAHPITKQ